MTRQIFDELDDPTLRALTESIEANGMVHPVTVDQHGDIIDGHHRAKIADTLGIEYPTEEVYVRDEAHALELARTLNEDRRQLLDIDERRRRVAELRAEGMSQRAIAEEIGASRAAVRRDLEQVGRPAHLDQRATTTDRTTTSTSTTVTGRDGKQYPASRPTPPALTWESAVEMHPFLTPLPAKLRREFLLGVEQLERDFTGDDYEQRRGILKRHAEMAVRRASEPTPERPTSIAADFVDLLASVGVMAEQITGDDIAATEGAVASAIDALSRIGTPRLRSVK